MDAKAQRLVDSCEKKILAGAPEELRDRISKKARNAIGVEREREKKKTPQMRKWNGEVWAGIFAIPTKNMTLAQAAQAYQDVRVVVVALRKDGYDVEADWWLEGKEENELYITGIRFLSLLKRSEQPLE